MLSRQGRRKPLIYDGGVLRQRDAIEIDDIAVDHEDDVRSYSIYALRMVYGSRQSRARVLVGFPPVVLDLDVLRRWAGRAQDGVQEIWVDARPRVPGRTSHRVQYVHAGGNEELLSAGGGPSPQYQRGALRLHGQHGRPKLREIIPAPELDRVYRLADVIVLEVTSRDLHDHIPRPGFRM